MTKWQTFFTHPMRPFFIGAAVVAIFSALSFFISDNFVILHRQLFLEIMLPAAYGGFLTAAMMEWTNFSGSLKTWASALGASILAALLLLPFLPNISAYLIALYWFILLLFAITLIWRDKNTDQFALLLLLVCFTVFQAAYAHTGDLTWLRSQIHLNIAAVMFVSFRVSILLGSEALKRSSLKDPVFIPNVVYKNIAITLLLLYTLTERLLPTPAVGFSALGVGCILAAKLRELHHTELLRLHYVRTYYWLQVCCAIGYLWLGACKLTGQFDSAPLHLITLGGLFGAIMVVFLTAGLWHSGFTQLNYPKLCRIAVPLLFITAIARSVLSHWHSAFYITIPALLLIAVFVLYLLTFMPIFRSRAFTDDPE